MQEIYEQLSLGISLKQRSTASDFHARLSAWQESEGALKIQEALYSLKSCGWLKNDTLIFSLPKMSKDCSITTTDEHSEQSSEQWMNWGTMSNGKFVTANTWGYPKTGKECSLSDIIEGGGIDEKYFLSTQTIRRLMNYEDTKVILPTQ